MWKKGKWITCICVLLLYFYPNVALAAESAPDPEPVIHARSYVLIDYETGTVLAGKDEDKPYPPASMTKMMPIFIVLDYIKAGKLAWDDQVKISPRVESIDESQLYLKAGEEMTVKELFIAMVVRSANDATVALTEKIAGSEEKFVALMNQKAKELGLKNTHFYASTGLEKTDYINPPKTSGSHVMSAKDSALLAMHLIKTHPEVLQYTSISQYTFRKDSDQPLLSNNTNRMLPGRPNYYLGADGVKTGYTDQAGYCFTGTAQKDGQRLIVVVMGASTVDDSFRETARLFEYGFNNFQIKTFFKKNEKPPTQNKVVVKNGTERAASLVIDQALQLPIRRGEEQYYTYKVTIPQEIKAPKKKGTVVGKVQLYYRGKEVPSASSNIVLAHNVEKQGWFMQLLRDIGDKFSRNFG
jgi:D-alanyl-D-alanine carboxypeptidase (penicillin-binding protein 5/6)